MTADGRTSTAMRLTLGWPSWRRLTILGGVQIDASSLRNHGCTGSRCLSRPLGRHPAVGRQREEEGILPHVLNALPVGLVVKFGVDASPDHGGRPQGVVASVFLGYATEVVLGEIAIAHPLVLDRLVR
jgi:hypothetical protein